MTPTTGTTTNGASASTTIAAATVPTYGHRASDLLESSALDYSATVEGNTIVIYDDVELGTDPLATITFLAFLRTALTENVAVHWNARISPTSTNTDNPLDTAPLHHLPPPTTIVGAAPEQLHAWRSAYRYGLCYFRRGPNFILIKDSRLTGNHVHLTIDHPDLIATFLTACAPLHASTLTPTQREAVAVLTAENLIYRQDGLLLTLPTRMRRWPIPFSAI